MADQLNPAQAIDGISIFRASRMEALLDPLIELMARAAPVAALAPHNVVAAHPGVRQWLIHALARRQGSAGIVANVDIVLPSTWLDDLAREVLGESAVALRPYRREALRWQVHECLDAVADAEVAAYLRGSDPARRRFQLADRIAALYTRYFIYRRDWLEAWQRGRADVPEPTFLAALWRRVRERIGTAHRGELIERLAARLQRDRATPIAEHPLHVFGVSHLAPAELKLLRAVAAHRLVVIYVPDPCIEYWAGLRSDLARLRALVALEDLPADAQDLFLEQDHPLLAGWGRIGQHLMLGLSALADEVRLDLRNWRDEALPGTPLDRLHSLQESVRRLDPSRIRPGRCGDPAALADRSLRVHACHTRLRELEVLRDALLRARVECPDLKASDIVVMAPNIQRYVPLLASVFGEAGRHDGPLPYHLADVAVSRSHRILGAFESLLALPQSRFTASEIVDLLDVPEIARALGLDAAGVDVLQGWLQRSRVAWALDPAFREACGVPGIAEHTFAWGMDRLLAGYVLGEAGDGTRRAQAFADGTTLLPVEGVHGAQAEVIGALDRLLRELAALREDLARARPASAWAARLEQMIDGLFRIDPAEAEAREALLLLRRFVRAPALEAGDCALDPVLEFSVVREVLRERLSAAPERQRFLAGAVTFCGMVPQRAVPFRVIAVLGLDEGEFPRAAGDGGLDLMARHPRIGDRDVRNDDRYLFLETLMSARDMLHLSYIGEGVRDAKPRNPSPPLAELLSLLDAHADLPEHDRGQVDRPWLVRHPLQPFDPRYFDGADVRLFSFRAELADLSRDDTRDARPFVDASPEATSMDARAAALPPAHEDSRTVPLSEVFAYFKDPARQLLRNGLQVRLDALDEARVRSSEPLDARFERLDRVARRLFLEIAAGPAAGWQVPAAPPDWLRLDGLWPPGHAGEDAWREESAKVRAVLDQAAAHALFAQGLPASLALAVDRGIGGWHVRGELARAYRGAAADWLCEVFPDRKHEADLGFRERIGVFIEWALLRLHDSAGARPVRLLLLFGDDRPHPWQDALNGRDDAFIAARARGDDALAGALLADLERRVAALLAFWAAAQIRPRWYFPKTSWAAAVAKPDADVATTWNGSPDRYGERDYAPGYAALLARDARFEPGHADYVELVGNARALHALIGFDSAETTHA